MARFASLLLTALLTAAAAGQSLNPIEESALGFPVPAPVESLEPVEGFRTLEALEARWLDLALGSEQIARHGLGELASGRELAVYTIGSGPVSPDGTARPAAFLLGGAHAREWISHEVVTDIVEWFALEAPGDPLGEFLLGEVHLVVMPVSNPDGFVKTQAYPATTVNGLASGAGGRDGRMRRKNLRNATPTLEPVTGYLNGVDLNRNFPIGWSSTAGQTSLTYGGPEHGSEAETQAVYTAEGQLAGSDFRLFVDFHSFGQYYYVAQRGTALDEATEENYRIMRDASLGETGALYGRLPWQVPAQAIGAADEYFSATHGLMSYTAEIRPSSSPNGFILPEAEVDAARREMRAAALAALYYTAGPAWLREVELRDTTATTWDAAPAVHHEARTPVAGTSSRQRDVGAGAPLRPGHGYTARLEFSKPMRAADGGALLPGFPPGAPQATLGGLAPDAWEWVTPSALSLQWTVPPEADLPELLLLSVDVPDAVGMPLDGDAATVSGWMADHGWTGWERGGDEWTTIPFAEEPSAAPSDAWILH